MRRTILAFGIALTLSAQYQNAFKATWLEPGGGEVLPEFDSFDSENGTLGVLNASGSLKTDGHPFFTALGTNGRACVSCHQPTWGMTVSASGLVDRWRVTDGKDPVFAAFEGPPPPHRPGDFGPPPPDRPAPLERQNVTGGRYGFALDPEMQKLSTEEVRLEAKARDISAHYRATTVETSTTSCAATSKT